MNAANSLVAHAAWFREAPAIELLYVHPPIPIGLVRQHLSQEVLDRYHREEGEAVLAPVRRRLHEAGLNCREHLHVGPPAETIVRLAGELGCELICMGSHGRGALATAVVGSVAHKVLQLADRPVLLAR